MTVLVIATGLHNEANPSEIVPEVSGLTETDMLSTADASQVESVISKLNRHPPHSMTAMEIEKTLTAATWATVSQCRCGPNCYKIPGGGRPLCEAIQNRSKGKHKCVYKFFLNKKQSKCSSSWGQLMNKDERAKKAAESVAKTAERAMKTKHAFEVAAEKKEKKKKEKNGKICHKAPIMKSVPNGIGGRAQCGSDSCGKFVGFTSSRKSSTYPEYAANNKNNPFQQNNAQCAAVYGAGVHWCTPQEMKAFTKADFKLMYKKGSTGWTTCACGTWKPHCGMGASYPSSGCWYFTCGQPSGYGWRAAFKDVCQGGQMACCKGQRGVLRL